MWKAYIKDIGDRALNKMNHESVKYRELKDLLDHPIGDQQAEEIVNRAAAKNIIGIPKDLDENN